MKITAAKSRVAAALVLSLLVSAARADTPPPLPAPIAGQDYHLVKDWDFAKIADTDALRQEFYTRYPQNNGSLDHLGNEWERYRDHDNHEISNGALHLIARAPMGELKPGEIESGLIRSKWRGRYGYYEAKIKVPAGRGMWPAFWLSSEDWPPEIDVVEVVNNGSNTTANSFHSLHGNYIGKTISTKMQPNGPYAPGFDFSKDYHTFAVEWTPTSVRHYVDNMLVVEREYQWRDNSGKEAPPAPVMLNLAVGGDWPKAPTSLADFPASMDIAYVRVWQK